MAQLTLLLLGPFQALLNGAPITGFESARVRALLIYLAVERARPHPRESLVELFWPEQPSGVGAANLRHALANLRKAIGDQRATPPFLLITPATLQFNSASNTVMDLDRFHALLANDSTPAARQAALALYRSHFLEGFSLDHSPDFELWLTVQRERIDYLAGQALATLVNQAVQQGDFAQAVTWTQQQLTLDALNEDVHHQLIWLLAHSGQRAAALHHYDLCSELLRQELAVAPQAALQTLVTRIRAGSHDLGVIDGQDGQPLTAPPTLPARPPPVVAPLIRLPTPPTPFIGREAELALVAERLADPACRLLTIVGPGGIGKTRLARQAATVAAAHFSHGVCFVELTAVATADQIPGAILAALGRAHNRTVEPRRQLLDELQPRRLLLVLDNFEHLLEGAALLVELLQGAPLLKLLVTSRARLNLREEWLLPLEGLALPPAVAGPTPPASAPMAPVDDWARYAAPRLFLHCIRRLQPAFQPTPAEATAILQICRSLEGMPLGIELAAAWVRTLPLPAIVHEMAHSLTLLTTSLRDMPARHRSMSALFDHSWRLLTARERSLLRQFAVFRGGCTRAAAAAVTGATLTDLAALVDKSWLRLRADERYEMHELVRQYCEEQLASEPPAVDGETIDQVRNRHGAYFADDLAGVLSRMNYRQEAMPAVMAEMGNLLAGLQWAAQTGNVEAARQMIIGLFFVAEMLGWYHFALQVYDAAVALLTAEVPADAITAQHTENRTLILCWLRWCQAHLYRSMGFLERATADVERIFTRLAGVAASRHRRWLELTTHWLQAQLTQCSGDLLTARQRTEAVLARCQEGDFPALFYDQTVEAHFFQAHAHALLGLIAWQLGDYAEARQQVQQTLALRDRVGEQRYKAFNLVTLVMILQTVGEQEQAARCVQEALQISQAGGDAITHAHALVALARLERAQGAYAVAEEHTQVSLALGRQSGNHRLLMEVLIEAGWLALARDEPAAAKAWFDEAIATFARLETAHSNYLAGVWLGLGWVALAAQEPASARHYFRQSLTTRGAAAWELLSASAGLAEVALTAGQPAAAVQGLDLVVRHPATARITRTEACQRLSTLEQSLPPGACAEWISQSRGCDLAALVATLIGGETPMPEIEYVVQRLSRMGG
jgi:predicted ATPase/DNA-binding SARP family transcriptional activator/Tfp pilus assembly protein PilF